MPHPYDEVRQFALELSYDERAKLSEELCRSLHQPGESLPEAEIDASWQAEVERRVADIKAGTAETYSWEEVEAELRAIVGP
jgi:putative addiction module component (TIGR02574 family)